MCPWILYLVLKGSVGCQILCQNKKSLLIPSPGPTDQAPSDFTFYLSTQTRYSVTPEPFNFPISRYVNFSVHIKLNNL